MINFIAWVIFGGLLGWIASITLNDSAQRNSLMNIAVGIVGAVIAGGVLAPLLGIANINRNNLSITALGIALCGAIVLPVLLNYFRPGWLR